MLEPKDYEIKILKRRILITNLKAWMVGVLLIAEIIFIVALFSKSGYLKEPVTGNKRVAVITFDELITEEYTTRVMEKMDKILKDKDYKEVLFIMSSPGGSRNNFV